MTDYQLKHLTETWQKILRLQDWDIAVAFARFREMQSEGGAIPWGRIMINRQHRNADIAILHPDDYEQCDDKCCHSKHGTNEIETTLVHELLHIYITGKNAEDPATTEEEQAINAVAAALVFLKREMDGDKE